MKKKWDKITPGVVFIAGVAFMSHSLEFDHHGLEVDVKQLHSHQEKYEPFSTRTTLVTTTTSYSTTTTTTT